MRWWLVVFAGTFALSVAGCGASGTPGRSSRNAATTVAPDTTRPPPEAGYRGSENFCATAPLSGHVTYDGTAGRLDRVFTFDVDGLPPNATGYVDWSNDHVRGYIVATFTTDSSGRVSPSSVDVARLAEVRGVEMVLESTGVPPTVFGRLEPC